MSIAMPVSPGTFSDDNIDNESTSEVGSAKYLDLKVSKWLSYKIVGLPKEVIHRSLSRVKLARPVSVQDPVFRPLLS